MSRQLRSEPRSEAQTSKAPLRTRRAQRQAAPRKLKGNEELRSKDVDKQIRAGSFSRSLGDAPNEAASKVQTKPHVTQCSRCVKNSGLNQAVVRMSPGVYSHQCTHPFGPLLLLGLAKHQEPRILIYETGLGI